MTVRGLLLLGCGGHARSAANVALACGVTQLVFVDANAKEGERCLGFPLLPDWPSRLPEGWQVLPAAGDNDRRRLQCAQATARGWPLATLIAPTATVGECSDIGAACLIGHHAHIGPAARLGQGCIVNTGAIVEHETVLGAYCHVAINAAVAGRCRLGQAVLIGAGATVIDGLKLGDGVLLGAGACAVSDLAAAGVYLGVPARRAAH